LESKVIGRLAADLRAEFPGMRGLSQRSLVYMRTFAAPGRGTNCAATCSRYPRPLIVVSTRCDTSLSGHADVNGVGSRVLAPMLV